jgi:hypothetical protein
MALLAPVETSFADQQTLTLTPDEAINTVGTHHSLRATLTDGGTPLPGRTVIFMVSGANTASGEAITDAGGNATFTYTGTTAGTDTITAFGDLNGNGMQDPGEPSDTATKTWHDPKDPRTADWPKLTDAEMRSVQDLIDDAKEAQDAKQPDAANKARADALAQLVSVLKRYCCTFHTMQGGAPIYDKGLTSDGSAQKRKGGRVRIGKGAFRSAAFLYSTLKHEMVHSMQWQDEDAARRTPHKEQELEAHRREEDQAGNTGLSEAELNTVKARIQQYERDFRRPQFVRASDPVAGPATDVVFRIALRRRSFAEGVPVAVRMSLKNNGDSPVTVNRRFLVNHGATPPEFREVTFAITMPDGDRAPFAWLLTVSFPDRDDFRRLRPGQSVSATADLADLYFLRGPGRYTVRATYRNVHPGPTRIGERVRTRNIGAVRGRRASNELSFRIV